ncbi:MAG: GNAT family N-acetyltransferase [Marmoricola sp.]
MTALRAATSADASDITTLEENLFGADAWSITTVQHSLAAGQVLVSDPRGYVVVSVDGDIADLQRIAVDPDHRRAGVAHALLEGAVAHATVAGADRVLLEVRADNADALAFYAAEGFVEIDRRHRYFRDGADAIVMQLAWWHDDVRATT